MNCVQLTVGGHHRSDAARKNEAVVYLLRCRHCSASRRPHSLTSTECGRREAEVPGMHRRYTRARRRRDIAPMDGCEPFVT